MRIALGTWNLLLGLGLLILALMTLGDNWKIPALVLLVGGLAAMLLGAGLMARVRSLRWLVWPLITVLTLIAVYLVAGCLVWPVAVQLLIILAYLLLLAAAAATLVVMRRFH